MTGFSSLLIGNNALLVQCAERILDGGHTVSAVATSDATVRGWAVSRSIPVLAHDQTLATQVIAFSYDWLFSIANLKLVPDAVWSKARRGAINFHDGPLPDRAGLNTPAWSILDGETTHGVTWHRITSGIDEGEVHAQRLFDLSPHETSLSLNTKCFEAGIASFEALLTDIETGQLQGQPQDRRNRRYFGRFKRPAAAGLLRWDRPAAELSRLVRGLSFGAGYRNPLVMPKLRLNDHVFSVRSLERAETSASATPGTVLAVESAGVVVATADLPVRIDAVQAADGSDRPLSLFVTPGMVLPSLAQADADRLSAAVDLVVPAEQRFRKALERATDLDLFFVQAAEAMAAPRPETLPLPALAAFEPTSRISAVAALMARLSGASDFDLAFSSISATDLASDHPGIFASSVPLRVSAGDNETVADFSAKLADGVADLEKHGSYLCDIAERFPTMRLPQLSVGVSLSRTDRIEGCALLFALGNEPTLHYDANRISATEARRLAMRLGVLAAAFADGDRALGDLPLMSEDERAHVLYGLNRSERALDRTLCMHQLIEAQVDRMPDAPALAAGGDSLSYRQMEAQANRIAHGLKALGVGPDTLVGLHAPRSVDLVLGAIAIHKAGGAYVPLDPHFPADRLALMVEDSRAGVVLATRSLAASPAIQGAHVVCIEDLLESDAPAARPVSSASPENLAYVIYTSGSTGRPKGVMIEHRNAVNFFAGMDDRIRVREDGRNVWLAVTSLSFDISVLELFWTLSRGFKVVVHSAEVRAHKALPDTNPGETPVEFGLFFWGNDDGAGPAKYHTLLEGAKFADAHGFNALWTPERHFHAFGGPYPNPSVTGAAVAAVTKNLSIRAGSCVLPLHHPARVAEEWAVIDNLSNGRVGLAFASGWMPEDFVLRPENAPPRNKAAMLEDIETVRKLWRGEAVDFAFGEKSVSVLTQPRPVQSELPVWVTTAGNPDTYREAARLGANVLTHLLGQSIDELADKIRIYRETLVEHGRDPANHKVTLMLHTLLGADREEVRERAREPMKDYLRSAAALIKQYAWAFPAFKKPQNVTQPMQIDLQGLAPEEMDAILDFAFQRYFEDSGLFGTVEDALERVAQVKAIGVDEIACLIDFGLPSAIVLERLQPLADVVKRSREIGTAVPAGFAAEVKAHGITHMQCTPSMARMFMANDEDRRALAQVRHLFIGGEALHGSLVKELNSLTDATIENMYGPTETTIWSSTLSVKPRDGVVPLGAPIANTQLYVLDAQQRPVPPGMPGELSIGGEGVARGYFDRAALTAERFLPNPFAEGRLYRTGDLVRLADDGSLQFLGRTDFQVKVRGYRIELGEIETRLSAYPGVVEAVVAAREDRPGDVRIVAYLRTSSPLPVDALRRHLAETLPDYMIPAHFVTLDRFPLTPNAKVDRNKLPAPVSEGIAPVAPCDDAAPANDMQRGVAEAFRRTLGVERVGVGDNFFALGGHSLLAVQLHRELKSTLAPQMTITDLFRFPTVSALAAHLGGSAGSEERLDRIVDRAAQRRNAMLDRQRAMGRVRNAV